MEPRLSVFAHRAAQTPQYIAAISACLGAIEVGAILGYTSPAGLQLTMRNGTMSEHVRLFDENFSLNKKEMAWVSSIVSIGALWGGLMGGTAINAFGRRGAMMLSVIPVFIGWILISLSVNFSMLLAGRVATGVFVGLTCVTVNTYIGEIASSNIRGTLGSGFQLLVNIGFLFSYSFGVILEWYYLAFLCNVIPIVFATAMFFNKESPMYLLMKDRPAEAEAALRHFRGPHYPVEFEMRTMRQALQERTSQKIHITKLIMTPHILKPFLTSLALMFFQQFSGANAVLFNLSTIFKSAGTDISESLSSIIVGMVFVVGTLVSSIFIDKMGRKLLLSLSAGMMCVAQIGLGFFFYELDYETEWTLAYLQWLPLVSLMLFTFGLAIGFAPVPWLMMGELFSTDSRELASSIVTAMNWFFSFVVTVSFEFVQIAIYDFGAYWVFAAICFGAVLFSTFVVKETKGKSFEEINEMFGGPPIQLTPAPSEARFTPLL